MCYFFIFHQQSKRLQANRFNRHKKHKNDLLIIENIEINVKIIYNESNVIFIIVSINGKTLMMENKSNKLKGRRINLWRILSTMI